MSNITPILLFKCPGSRKGANGVLYQFSGASTTEEKEFLLSRGWFEKLDDAVKSAGKKAYAVVKRENPKK